MTERHDSSLGGMTVNERLVHVGLIDEWEAAARRHGRSAMIALLERVRVSRPERTVDTLLSDPAKYGF